MPNFGPQPEKSSAKSKNNPENKSESSKENLSVSEMIEKYGLQSGVRASFKKEEKFGDSPLDEGTVMGGVLENDVSIGSSIEFENQDAKISTIQDVYEENGDVYLTTQTSVYKLVRSEEIGQQEAWKFDDIDSVRTAKGSYYQYGESRTQRYKTVEDEMKAPMDALVYVPDWRWLSQHADQEQLSQIAENETQFHQKLLRYVQESGKKVFITNKDGDILDSNEDIKKEDGQIFTVFGTSRQDIDFMLPVSHTPRIGFNTYDTQKYKDEDTGEWTRRMHMGNKVVRINKKEE